MSRDRDALRKIATLDPQHNGWKMYGEAQRIACDAIDAEDDLLSATRAFLVWLDGYPRSDTTVPSVQAAVAEIRDAARQLRFQAGVPQP